MSCETSSLVCNQETISLIVGLLLMKFQERLLIFVVVDCCYHGVSFVCQLLVCKGQIFLLAYFLLFGWDLKHFYLSSLLVLFSKPENC